LARLILFPIGCGDIFPDKTDANMVATDRMTSKWPEVIESQVPKAMSR